MTTDSSAWTRALTSWTRALRAAGRPDTTITTRTYHLRRLTKIFPDPWAITTADLIDWTGGQTWAAETRRSYRSSLIMFYRWAVTSGHTDTNPAEHLPRVKPGQPRPRPTPDTTYKEALMTAPARTRLILRLAAEAGLRRAEIAVIHRRDLFADLDGYSLIVHGKGDKERTVPLTPGLAAEVRGCDGYVFPGNDSGHLSPRWVGKLATRVLPDDWTLHSLRHRFATSAYRVNRDVFTVQELLGHASPATTRIYVELPDDSKRRLVLAAVA